MKFHLSLLTAATLAIALSHILPTVATAMPAGEAALATPPRAVIPVAHKKRHAASRKRELDRSIENGTVPARYRASIPKQYQHYIPFEKTGR
jgi:hypothetical protein